MVQAHLDRLKFGDQRKPIFYRPPLPPLQTWGRLVLGCIKADFAYKCAFFRSLNVIFRDLQDLHSFSPLQIHSVEPCDFFLLISAIFFVKTLLFFADFFFRATC